MKKRYQLPAPAAHRRSWRSSLALMLVLGMGLTLMGQTGAAGSAESPDLLLDEPDHDLEDAWDPSGEQSYERTDLEDRAEIEGITIAEAESRFRREDAAVLVQRAARKAWPETYGGLWIDVEDTFDVIVAFTDDPMAKVEELRSDFPDPERIRGVEVELPLHKLREIQEQILEDREQVRQGRRPEGMPEEISATNGEYSVGLDARGGQIVIDVDGASRELQQSFSTHYSIPIELNEGAGSPDCTVWDCRPRILPGIAFNTCSVGFNVTRFSSPQTLSAGHCGGGSRYHAGTYYGYVQKSIAEGRTDAQRITQARWGWNHRNVIAVEHEGLREITDFFRVNDYVIGMQVGKTGKTTATTRGYIDDLNYQPHWVTNSTAFVRTDYCSDGGDSGGPVFRNNSALGVHSGGGTCSGVFGRIHYATYDLGVSLMTSDFNDAPQARFTASCSQFTCRFDGNGSRDVDGWISSYSWEFGDIVGSSDIIGSSSGSTTAHTYLLPGTYTVRLTVRDNGGKTDTTTRRVTVP